MLNKVDKTSLVKRKEDGISKFNTGDKSLGESLLKQQGDLRNTLNLIRAQKLISLGSEPKPPPFGDPQLIELGEEPKPPPFGDPQLIELGEEPKPPPFGDPELIELGEEPKPPPFGDPQLIELGEEPKPPPFGDPELIELGEEPKPPTFCEPTTPPNCDESQQKEKLYKAKLFNDPVMRGFDGEKGNIKKHGTYNLFEGSGVNLNARFGPWGADSKGQGSATKAVGLTITTDNGEEHKLHWGAGGVPKLDGEKLKNGRTELDDGSVIVKKGNNLKVITDEGLSIKIRKMTNTPQFGAYFNIGLTATENFAQASNYGGILGQSLDGDGEKDKINRKWNQFKTNGLFEN